MQPESSHVEKIREITSLIQKTSPRGRKKNPVYDSEDFKKFIERHYAKKKRTRKQEINSYRAFNVLRHLCHNVETCVKSILPGETSENVVRQHCELFLKFWRVRPTLLFEIEQIDRALWLSAAAQIFAQNQNGAKFLGRQAVSYVRRHRIARRYKRDLGGKKLFSKIERALDGYRELYPRMKAGEIKELLECVIMPGIYAGLDEEADSDIV